MAMRRLTRLVLLASFVLIAAACGSATSASPISSNSHIIVTKFNGALHVSASETSNLVAGHNLPQQVNNAFYLSKSVVFVTQTEGSNSALLKSSDGGKTWMFLSTLPGEEFGVDFVSASVGYLISRLSDGGPSDAIYTTSDGGKTWAMVFSGSVTALQFVTPQIGFALLQTPSSTAPNYSAGIYKTSNGGKTWSPVGATIDKYAVNGSFSFTSPSDGWLLVGVQPSAGSENKYLYKTTDGGSRWSVVAQARFSASQVNIINGILPPTGYVTQLQFISPTQGYMALARAGIYATDDAGSTWNLMSESPLSSHTLRNVVNFAIWGGTDLSLVTTNSNFFQSGSSGQMIRVYPPYLVQGIFDGPSGLYQLGHTQVVSLFDPSGSTQTIGTAPSGVVELDPLQSGIMALGSSGLFTSRRGNSWTKISLPTGWSVVQGKFVNSEVGYVVANDNGPPGSATIDLTTNGGGSWTKVTAPFRPFSIDPVSKDDLWALGGTELSASGNPSKGATTTYWNLYFSRDAGKSWNEFIANWKSVGSLDFLNAQEGYVSNGKYLYHTADGGLSFVRYRLPSALAGADIFSMTFGPGGSGWAIANSNYPIYHTIDSGGTWTLNPE